VGDLHSFQRRLPIGPLRALIGAPELHHWHHAREREAGNYANISPLMDFLFGTYRYPPREPESLGVDEPMPAGYFGQLLHPFRRRLSASVPEHAPDQPKAQRVAEPVAET